MSKSGMRDAMPQVAAFVDAARAACGTALVDAAIAAGVRLQRQHAAMAATHGQAAADLWLARQPRAIGGFWAREAGQQVGVRR